MYIYVKEDGQSMRAEVKGLLQERGFRMRCVYGHIHAIKDGVEYCLCEEARMLSARQCIEHLDRALCVAASFTSSKHEQISFATHATHFLRRWKNQRRANRKKANTIR
jgi:hypothetical protein